jgi:hypothetical protein
MFDWSRLLTGVVCVLGVAVVLASVSYCEWLAKTAGGGRYEAFRHPTRRVFLALGAFLIAFGATLARAGPGWQQALWLVVTALFAREIMRAVRARRVGRPEGRTAASLSA